MTLKFKPFLKGDAFVWMCMGFGSVLAGIVGLTINLVTNSWSNTRDWCIMAGMGLCLFYVSGNYFAVLTIQARKK